MIRILPLLAIGMGFLGACTPSFNQELTPIGLPASTSEIIRQPITITPSTTLTQSPSPSPPLKFFIEEFDTSPPYWSEFVSIGDNEHQDQFAAGYLAIHLKSPNTWAYHLFEPYVYADVRVDAFFEPRGSEPSSTGVVCRYDPEQGWYEFSLSREGTYNVLVGQWLTAEIPQYTPILYEESEYIKQNETGYEIGLGCLANDLWLYINGKLIRKVNVQRYGLTEGKIGFAVSSFDNTPVISAFEWFKVGEP